MAKYTIEYDHSKNQVVKTLVFMGQEFKEEWLDVWEGYGKPYCETRIKELVEKDLHELPQNIFETVQNIIDSNNNYETSKYLKILSDYEWLIQVRGEIINKTEKI